MTRLISALAPSGSISRMFAPPKKRVTDGQTNGPMDQRTDGPTYGGTHLIESIVTTKNAVDNVLEAEENPRPRSELYTNNLALKALSVFRLQVWSIIVRRSTC